MKWVKKSRMVFELLNEMKTLRFVVVTLLYEQTRKNY